MNINKYSDLTCLLIGKSLHINWETYYLLYFDANDLLKVWPTIFFFKMRNVRPRKYSRPWWNFVWIRLSRKRHRRTHRRYLLPLRQLKRVIWKWNYLRSNQVNLVDRRWRGKRFGISLSLRFIRRNRLVTLINLRIWRVCWLIERMILFLRWVWLFKIIRKL